MNIGFAKYHGTGNDFIIVRSAALNGVNPADFAVKACARTTGIGADGLLICRENPLTMEIVNSDGSGAPMCGNGIRCFASYCLDEGIVSPDIFPVQTDAGEMVVSVLNREPFLCEINMGRPDWRPEAAGIMDTADDDFLGKSVTLPDGKSIIVSSLLMGTFHTVVWLGENENANAGVPDIRDEQALETFGRTIHDMPVFTKRTNVNMAVVSGKDEITLRTYERGAGMTAACGTGACAAAVVAKRQGKTGNKVTVKLPLGALNIRIEADETVYMAGPAVRVFSGTYEDYHGYCDRDDCGRDDCGHGK